REPGWLVRPRHPAALGRRAGAVQDRHREGPHGARGRKPLEPQSRTTGLPRGHGRKERRMNERRESKDEKTPGASARELGSPVLSRLSALIRIGRSYQTDNQVFGGQLDGFMS